MLETKEQLAQLYGARTPSDVLNRRGYDYNAKMARERQKEDMITGRLLQETPDSPVQQLDTEAIRTSSTLTPLTENTPVTPSSL